MATDLTSAFDNGNGGKKGTFESPANTLHIYAERDNDSYDARTDWFHFQLTDVNGKTLTLNVDFNYWTSPSFYGDSNEGIRPVWSYDGITWYRLSSCSYSSGMITFTLPQMAQSSVYVAMDYPYTYTNMVADMATWLASPYATGGALSYSGKNTSQGGRNIYHLQVKEDGFYTNRLYLVFTARLHTNELQSSRLVRGMIKWLLSNDTNAVAVRRKCVIDFFPMCNPDGVYEGNMRVFNNNQDANRQYLVTGPTIYDEPSSMFLLHSKLDDISGTTQISLDLHSDHVAPARLCYDNVNGTMPAAEVEAIQQALNGFDTDDYYQNTKVEYVSSFTTVLRRGQTDQYGYDCLLIEGATYDMNSGVYPTELNREKAGVDLLRALESASGAAIVIPGAGGNGCAWTGVGSIAWDGSGIIAWDLL